MRRYRISFILIIAFFFLKGCVMPGPRSSIVGVQSLEAQTSSHTIHYFQNGEEEKTRVVYVHGTPGDASMFESYLSNPVKGTESVSISRPGFGLSKPRHAVTDLKIHAEALLLFLDEEGDEKPILVGHSYGGPVVAKAAVLYPEKIGGIVIVAGSVAPQLEPSTWWRYPFAIYPVKWLIGSSLYNSNREIMNLRNELEIMEVELADLEVPVFVVHGTDDWLVPYGNKEFMDSVVPEDQMIGSITIGDGNHFIPWNAEKELRDAILTTLNFQKRDLGLPEIEISVPMTSTDSATSDSISNSQ